MDPATVLMLSTLLQLQQSLEPSPLAASSTTAPLLFFTLTAVLAHAVAIFSHFNIDIPGPHSPPFPPSSAWPSLRSPPSLPRSIDRQMLCLDPSTRDTQWRHVYGVSYPLFTSLLKDLKPYLKGKIFNMPVDAAVGMVLHRLAHGFSLRRLAAEYGTEPRIVARIGKSVTKALATRLYPKYVSIPSGQELLEIIEGFKNLTGLPNMCGAIDGNHVRIHKRPGDGYDPAIYRCRHHFFAILLQAVCDHRKLFWDVCVKAPGATEDATHLRHSSLFKKLIHGEVLLDSIVSIRGNHIRPYIVGDWSYPLLSFLLTPYSGRGSGTPGQNLFDARLTKGRVVMQQALGILKGRWQILQNLNVGLNHAPQTIVACCVLHNMCVRAGEPEPALFPEPCESGPAAQPLESEKTFNYFGESMRQALLEEFLEKEQPHLYLLNNFT